jgi:hypothetical protein
VPTSPVSKTKPPEPVLPKPLVRCVKASLCLSLINRYLGLGAIEKGCSLNEKKLVYIKNKTTKIKMLERNYLVGIKMSTIYAHTELKVMINFS